MPDSKDTTTTADPAAVDTTHAEARKPDPDATPPASQEEAADAVKDAISQLEGTDAQLADAATLGVVGDRWVPGSELRDANANPWVKQARRAAENDGVARNSDRGVAAAEKAKKK